MNMLAEIQPQGSAGGNLYDPDMAKRVMLGLEETRRSLGERVKKAEQDGELTIVTRHGKPSVGIIPYELLVRALAALGEPTDTWPSPPEPPKE